MLNFESIHLYFSKLTLNQFKLLNSKRVKVNFIYEIKRSNLLTFIVRIIQNINQIICCHGDIYLLCVTIVIIPTKKNVYIYR